MEVENTVSGGVLGRLWQPRGTRPLSRRTWCARTSWRPVRTSFSTSPLRYAPLLRAS